MVVSLCFSAFSFFFSYLYNVKQVFSIAIASLVLFSSLGFSVATHYCGGKKIMSELVLADGDLSCGMIEKTCATPSEYGFSFNKVCCENELIAVDLDDDFKLDIAQVHDATDFVIAFVYVFLLPNFTTSATSNTVVYSPPPLKQNRQILFQSFLLYDKFLA